METRNVNRGFFFWFIQIPGWLLFVYLVIAQGISAFSYDWGVSMGFQEPAGKITEVGTAFWYGFAFGDLVFYIPILLIGLIGHIRGTHWGRISLGAALGITVYWPIVCLAAIATARDTPGWDLERESQYWTVLPLILIWSVCSLASLLSEQQERRDRQSVTVENIQGK